jgi:hypothetical protein
VRDLAGWNDLKFEQHTRSVICREWCEWAQWPQVLVCTGRRAPLNRHSCRARTPRQYAVGVRSVCVACGAAVGPTTWRLPPNPPAGACRPPNSSTILSFPDETYMYKLVLSGLAHNYARAACWANTEAQGGCRCRAFRLLKRRCCNGHAKRRLELEDRGPAGCRRRQDVDPQGPAGCKEGGEVL